MKVFDAESLKQERERLKQKIKNHEDELHESLSGAEQSLGPIARFFIRKPLAENESDQNDWFHKAARLLIPFLVDRVTLGTRGLFINRTMNAALQFLARKISGEKLNGFIQDLLVKGFDRLKMGKKTKSPII